MKLPALATLLLTLSSLLFSAEDLRESYNTRSLPAAQAIQKAIRLQEQKQPRESLASIEEAIKLDPNCSMAYYVRAGSLFDLSQVDEALESYKQAVAKGTTKSTIITVDASNNLGLTYGRLGKFDESAKWFSRAILEDPSNSVKLRGKAYRNLAITLTNQQRFASAYMAVLLAYADDPKNTQIDHVMEIARMIREGDESAEVINLGEKMSPPPPRADAGKLAFAEATGTISENIVQLLSDPAGGGVVAFVSNAPHFYRIESGAKPIVKKVALQKTIHCGCIADGDIYVVAGQPAELIRLDDKGNAAESYSLQGLTPNSVAVFPKQAMAYVPGNASISALNLKTKRVSSTDYPARVVAADPAGKFLYTYNKEDAQRRGGASHILIQGRPIFIESSGFDGDWQQTTLARYHVVPDNLLFSGMRMNAASNGQRLVVSPDGNWVAVAGGGGWRPTGVQTSRGYGVAAFASSNFQQPVGFFATDAYPLGAAFNPVTGQIAAIREGDAHVYQLSNPAQADLLKGTFSGAGAWSGDGAFLLLGNKATGFSIFSNPLTDAEKTIAKNWWKTLKAAGTGLPGSGATAPVAVDAKPVEALASFAVQRTKGAVAGALNKALKEGRPVRPMDWQDFAPYTKDDSLLKLLSASQREQADRNIFVYQLKQLHDRTPGSPPVACSLADAQLNTNPTAETESLYLKAIQGDAGRTDISVRALAGLAKYYDTKKDSLAALFCAMNALALDRGDRGAWETAEPLLKSNGFEKEARKFAEEAPATAAAPATASRKLVKLDVTPAQGKALTAAEVFAQAADAVVTVSGEKGSGSGFCVGSPTQILTNWHVVNGSATIQVQPYIQKRGKLIRMEAIQATVVFASQEQDLAVLELSKDPGYMAPLPIADKAPRAGERVIAIGSPGMGAQVLEQTITEGIVSSPDRKVENQSFVQHTAAINPGNSGGPLLDDHGRVIGVVTLKAKLENVGFAIPIERVRAVFEGK